MAQIRGAGDCTDWADRRCVSGLFIPNAGRGVGEGVTLVGLSCSGKLDHMACMPHPDSIFLKM